MDLGLISWVIITLVAIGLTFVLIKGVIKAVMLSLSIISVLLLIFAFFVVRDVMDLQQNAMAKDKLVVLKDKDTVLAAFSFVNFTDVQKSITALKKSDLDTNGQNIKNDDLSKYKDQYYKVIIFDISAFNDSLDNGISYGDQGNQIALSKDEVLTFIKSDSPMDSLLGIMAKSKNMDLSSLSDSQRQEAIAQIKKQLNIESDEQFKDYVFGLMIADMVKDKGPMYAIVELKQDKIAVYPDSALFRAIHYVPMFIVEKAALKIPVGK